MPNSMTTNSPLDSHPIAKIMINAQALVFLAVVLSVIIIIIDNIIIVTNIFFSFPQSF